MEGSSASSPGVNPVASLPAVLTAWGPTRLWGPTLQIQFCLDSLPMQNKSFCSFCCLYFFCCSLTVSSLSISLAERMNATASKTFDLSDFLSCLISGIFLFFKISGFLELLSTHQMVLTGNPQSPNSKHSQIQSPRIKHKWKSKVWKCDVVPDSTSWGQKSKDRILGFLDFPKVVFRISGKTTVWISGNSQVFFFGSFNFGFWVSAFGDSGSRLPEAGGPKPFPLSNPSWIVRNWCCWHFLQFL